MLDISNLPKLDPRVLETANELASFAFDLQISDAEPFNELKVSCPVSAEPKDTEDLVICQIAADFGNIALTVERELIDFICDRTLPGWRAEDPEKLLLSWRTIVCIEEILRVLGKDDIEYSVVGVDVPKEPVEFLNSTTVEIVIDGYRSKITIILGPIDTEIFTQSFGQPSKKTLPTSAIDVPVRGRLVGRSLTDRELGQLSVGDALLLYQNQNGDMICEVDVGPPQVFKGRCTPDGNFTILGQDSINDK